MSSEILFRSIKSGRQASGSSYISVVQRGPSWSHLRPYADTDDVRDIVWTRPRNDGLPVRVRENHGSFDIFVYIGSTLYDDFTTIERQVSRKKYIKEVQNILKKSAESGKYRYQDFSENSIEGLARVKPKNSLIIVCNTAIDDRIRLLAFYNDLIYIDLHHPYEADPDDTILFSGQVLDVRSYQAEYLQLQETRASSIRKLGGSYISLSTDTDIAARLNTFFKKRYTYG